MGGYTMGGYTTGVRGEVRVLDYEQVSMAASSAVHVMRGRAAARFAAPWLPHFECNTYLNSRVSDAACSCSARCTSAGWLCRSCPAVPSTRPWAGVNSGGRVKRQLTTPQQEKFAHQLFMKKPSQAGLSARFGEISIIALLYRYAQCNGRFTQKLLPKFRA